MKQITVTFNPDDYTIEFSEQGGAPFYWIELTTCTTSAKTLDLICQVGTKRWATPDVIGQLVKMIIRTLHPQGSLCGSGIEQGPIDPQAVINNLLKFDAMLHDIFPLKDPQP